VLELAILGLLKEQPLHGYELKKRLGDTLGFLWGVSYGSLYPALRRLERAGAIESASGAAPTGPRAVTTGSLKGELAAARRRTVAGRVTAGRRTRKSYRITERGEELFAELLLADDERADDERAFTLKLAFCRHLSAPARLTLLERRRDALSGRLERARRPTDPRESADRYTRSLVEHRKDTTARDLEWVEQLIAAERGDGTDHSLPEGATA
jgi:DNA-binding PadR family transcriptional regulator